MTTWPLSDARTHAANSLRERLDAATAALDPPFAVVDRQAFRANAADLVRRAAGTPVRVASKSVRVRSLLDRGSGVRRVARRDGLHPRAKRCGWCVRGVSDDVLVAYPTVDRAALAALSSDDAAGRRRHADGRRRRPARPGGQRRASGRSTGRCGSAWSSTRRGRCPAAAVRVGVRRSPVSTPSALAALAAVVVGAAGLRAGRADGLRGADRRARRRRSRPAVAWPCGRCSAGPAREIAERRAAAVAAVRAVAPLEFVNGGGTGSLESTAAEAAVTEVTAGSGLFGSVLFDHYRAWHPQPAALFALPVVRRPGPGVVTVLGGGWVASGPSGRDRLPAPWLPDRPAPRRTRGRRRGADAGARRGCRPAGGRRPRVVPARQGRRALRARRTRCTSSTATRWSGSAETYRGEGKAFL